MKYLQILLSLISLLPGLMTLVNQAVQAVEQALPTASGAQKLAAVEAQINTFIAAVTTEAKALGDLQTVLRPLINSAVAMYNAAGIFSHRPQATEDRPSAG